MTGLTARSAAVVLAAGIALTGVAALPSAAFASTAPPCVPSSSPFQACSSSVTGPTPQSVRVGNFFTVKAKEFKPGSIVTVYIKHFPKGKQYYTRRTASNGVATFRIAVPLNVRAPGITSVSIRGTNINGRKVSYGKSLQWHTAVNKNVVSKLRKLGFIYNIAPAVRSSSDRARLGFKGSATGGTIAAAAPAAVVAAAPTAGLAFTGAEIGGMSVVGLGLVGTGAFLVIGTRRRRNSDPA